MTDTENRPLRTLFVLRQVQIPWSELKAGDVFRTGKASPTDCYAEETNWSIATHDVSPELPPAEWRVQRMHVRTVSCHGPGAKEKEICFMPPIVEEKKK